MKYSELILYLKTHLERPSTNFKWTNENNQKFFDFLDENAPVDYLSKMENLLEIKKAFKEYFENVGYILFQLKNHTIKFKVFEYKVEPKDSSNVYKIVSLIEKNEKFILKNYNGRSDHILIEKELKDKIYAFIDTLDEENINKKELVKYSVRNSFKLNEKDIIIVKEESIFVKMCKVSNTQSLSANQENLTDRRFNGIDINELETFNIEHFSSQDDKAFFNLAATLFVERYLLNKKITNEEYEKNVFSYVQSIITEQLINTFDHCENFFKGLAGYIFRIHFLEVFEYISEAILVELSLSNSYMIDFLRYYSSDPIVIAGHKYKTPALETDNGLKWNVISMLSIVKVYEKTNLSIKQTIHTIEKKEAEMLEFYVDAYSPVEYSHHSLVQEKSLLKQLIQYEKTLEICRDSITFAKTENDKIRIKEEIKLIKEEIKKTKEEKKILLNKVPSIKVVNTFLQLEKEVLSMNRQLKRDQKILGQNEESFLSIRNALCKALISKKKKMD